jgi:hypothetical protein
VFAELFSVSRIPCRGIPTAKLGEAQIGGV